MSTFLSPEWFTKVENLISQAQNLEVPAALQALIINLQVDNDGETVLLHLANGMLKQGAAADAPTTLLLDAATLKKVFLEFDTMAGMQAFMTGKMKVQGDMTKLMALQSASPNDAQRALTKAILDMTV